MLGKNLGIMMPLGGGDPIPLKKDEIVIGRRRSCDVQLDFENISGRHCMLRFANGGWIIRDLGSTNGTKVNGQTLQREQVILPDDELAIATHLFRVDYEPSSTILESHQVLEEEGLGAESKKPTSLMELAGFTEEGSGTARRPSRRPADDPSRDPDDDRLDDPRPDEAPELAAMNEKIPSDFEVPSSQASAPDDDDFFKLIEDDVFKDRG